MSDKATVHPHPAARPRAWEAAKVTLQSSGWVGSSQPIDVDIRHNLKTLRSRSREQAQNNDYVRGFLRDVRTNVIGHRGILLQSQVRARNGEADHGLRRTIEDAWIEWGEPDSCDATGRLSWRDFSCLVVDTMARDGEALVRHLPGWDRNRFGYAVQLIDPELLDVDYCDVVNGAQIVMGVEIDEWRRATAYWLSADEPGKSYSSAYRRGNRIRVPAEQIEHLYLPEWVHQTRGIPWLATALSTMRQVDGYIESAVIAARAGASKMGHYQRTHDAPIPGDEPGDAGPGGLADGRREDGQLFQDFDPGGIGILPPGWSFEGWDPAFPNANHDSFVSAMLRGISAGLGVSYHTLAQDLRGVNYSSLRHASLVERAVWMLLQDYVSAHLCRPVYREWLQTSLTSGALTGPSGRPLSMLRLGEFQRVRWQPRGWSWVDPQKELAGLQSEIRMRLQSVSGAMRERGRDPDETWQELADDKARLVELGLETGDLFDDLEMTDSNSDADDDEVTP
jgi:lambda family phage portal protein